jgi:hypothetical protein
VGTGFKDEDLSRLYEKMKGLVVDSTKKPFNNNVGDALEPDDWFQVQSTIKCVFRKTSVFLIGGGCVCGNFKRRIVKSSAHKGGIGPYDNSQSNFHFTK